MLTPQPTYRPLSRDEVRSIDRRAAEELGMPTALLMENAGRGAADLLKNWKPARPDVLILCGPGNNGGDGAVVARHLDLRGFSVRVVWVADPSRLKGDAALQWSILDRAGFDQTAQPSGEGLAPLMADAGLIIDALLGTGLARPVDGPLKAAIEAVNSSQRYVFSLDLPSGLDADRGVPHGIAVRAHLTATFVALQARFRSSRSTGLHGRCGGRRHRSAEDLAGIVSSK